MARSKKFHGVPTCTAAIVGGRNAQRKKLTVAIHKRCLVELIKIRVEEGSKSTVFYSLEISGGKWLWGQSGIGVIALTKRKREGRENIDF